MPQQILNGGGAVEASTAAMSAEDVRRALALRWPDSEYLSIAEAPEDASRQGRRLDLLVVSLWASRGFELDGVEIKVSLSDWKRELTQGAKADGWWRRTHRFWVAVPATLAPRVREDLPAGWGLLACEPDAAPKVAVKAIRHDAQPVSWPTVVGLLRASADAGVNALHRAEARGRTRGYEEGKAAGMRESGGAALEALRDKVRAFEEWTGLKVTDGYGLDDLGALVAIVRAEMREPGWTTRILGSAAKATADRAEAALKSARELEEAAARVSDRLAAARLPSGDAPASASAPHPHEQESVHG